MLLQLTAKPIETMDVQNEHILLHT